MILFHEQIVEVSSRGCCAFLRLSDWFDLVRLYSGRLVNDDWKGSINLLADLKIDGETIPGADLRATIDDLGGVRIEAHPDALDLPEFTIRHYPGDPIYRA